MSKPVWTDRVVEVSEEEALTLHKAGVEVFMDYFDGFFYWDNGINLRSHASRARAYFARVHPDDSYHKFFYIPKTEGC